MREPRSLVSHARRRLAGIAPLVLVGVVPAALLSVGVARFMLNHFFSDPPYLLDSGLLSGVAYRSGPLLAPPSIACSYATSFYQVYFSPIISVFSGLSYLLPVDRIEWFAFVQAMVFFPIGIAGYALASRVEPAGLVRRLPITIVAVFAFAFSGLTLWMIGYPHYEAATPGLVCLVLVAVVSGRTRLTWVFLALAASVRQDSGVHVALALAPLLYLRWRGTEMLPSRRRLIATIAVALGTTVLAFVCQKLLVVPVDRLRDVYLGTPAYRHLSASLLVARARNFIELDKVIYYPFVATLLVAVLRRDARYLLGWLAAVPWFLFSFTAHDGQKSSFGAYTAGPFLVSVFWVYLYGALLAPAKRRLRPGIIEAVFALVCASSTLGFYRAAPEALTMTTRRMAIAQRWNRAAVHGFVDALHRRRADLGRLYVDYAVAALAQEWLELGQVWYSGALPAPDSLAFHDRARDGGVAVLGDLIANQLDMCTHVLGTHIFVCSRERLPSGTFAGLATETFPSVFAFTNFHRFGTWADARGLGMLSGTRLRGALGPLARGSYEWTLTVTVDGPLAFGGSELARLVVESNPPKADRPAVAVDAPSGSGEIALRFEADGEESFTYDLASASSLPLHITAARLRRVEAR